MPCDSDDLPIYKVDDFAYTVLAQQIQSAPGVGQVASPASRTSPSASAPTRRRWRRTASASRRSARAIATATTNQAKGTLESRYQSLTLDANDQLFGASGYRDIIVAFRNGAPVKIRDIADVVDGARMPRSGAWYNGKKAEMLLVFRQPGANTTRIVDQVRAMMPQLQILAAEVDACRPDIRPLAGDRRVDRRREVHPDAHHRPGGHGDFPLPAALLGDRHPLGRRAAGARSAPSP